MNRNIGGEQLISQVELMVYNFLEAEMSNKCLMFSKSSVVEGE